MKKRAKVMFASFATVFVALAVLVYFFLPGMVADEVYPLKYTEFIVKYSTQYDVDPALVAAVILQESRFNPKAQSPVGAQGLMQFMPGTAATMAKETGHWPTYDIFDAETSVEFGAAHIRDLLVKYNGNVSQALVGYNAGTGTADRWISANIFDKVINSNSGSETVNYVKKVTHYQQVYTDMYATELGLNISTELKKADLEPQSAKVRGFVWSRIFDNIFNLGAK
jgi:soluble lytic murein transglycosylase